MGYGTDGLTFNTLRGGNLARLPQFKNNRGEPAHSEPDGSDWSVSEWLEAVTGELGEFANLHKKLRRGDLIAKSGEVYTARDLRTHDTPPGPTLAETVKLDFSRELADVVIYLDILAYQMGIDLGEAVMAKFNETSEKVGSTVRLAADDWHHVKTDG